MSKEYKKRANVTIVNTEGAKLSGTKIFVGGVEMLNPIDLQIEKMDLKAQEIIATIKVPVEEIKFRKESQ